jgi:uncharacterized protein (TIGR02284 family)
MTDSKPRTVEVLNWLLEGVHDSADGLRQAASLARNPSFQAIFNERASQRDALIGEIEAEVRSFGAEPACEGSMIGDIHHAFTKLRDLVAHGSDKAVVEEAARGEALIEQRFEAVAEDAQAPAKARELAGRVVAKLKTDQQQIAGLRQQFR